MGGSSAGAAIMSRVMIGGGNNRGTLHYPTVFGYDTYKEIDEKNDPVAPLILVQGLGFFPDGVLISISISVRACCVQLRLAWPTGKAFALVLQYLKTQHLSTMKAT